MAAMTQISGAYSASVDVFKIIGNTSIADVGPVADEVSSRSNFRKPDPVNNDVRTVIQVVNYVIICGCISLFGIGSNILNMTVFLKQGFKDSINISLFGLAVADFACLMTMFWTSISYNPAFRSSRLPFDPIHVMYLTGGWPHTCFNRVTSFITAFITMERCLCITLPLKVKNIITPFRTKVIIVSIFVIVFIAFSPFYFVNKLEWIFNKNLNRTILSLVYTQDREIVEAITFPIHSVALSSISLSTVIICTVILVVKLNNKTRWRRETVVQIASNAEATSTKDKRVVKMITFISTIFIICFAPATAIFFMMAYDPQFSFSGHFENTFFVVWSVSFVLETFNSSVNIFIYFNMSSKFKATLVETFCTPRTEK